MYPCRRCCSIAVDVSDRPAPVPRDICNPRFNDIQAAALAAAQFGYTPQQRALMFLEGYNAALNGFEQGATSARWSTGEPRCSASKWSTGGATATRIHTDNDNEHS